MTNKGEIIKKNQIIKSLNVAHDTLAHKHVKLQEKHNVLRTKHKEATNDKKHHDKIKVYNEQLMHSLDDHTIRISEYKDENKLQSQAIIREQHAVKLLNKDLSKRDKQIRKLQKYFEESKEVFDTKDKIIIAFNEEVKLLNKKLERVPKIDIIEKRMESKSDENLILKKKLHFAEETISQFQKDYNKSSKELISVKKQLEQAQAEVLEKDSYYPLLMMLERKQASKDIAELKQKLKDYSSQLDTKDHTQHILKEMNDQLVGVLKKVNKKKIKKKK